MKSAKQASFKPSVSGAPRRGKKPCDRTEQVALYRSSFESFRPAKNASTRRGAGTLFCRRMYKRTEIKVRRYKRNVLSSRQTGICHLERSIQYLCSMFPSSLRNSFSRTPPFLKIDFAEPTLSLSQVIRTLSIPSFLHSINASFTISVA